MRTAALALLLPTALLAACGGGLSTPDLGTGEISGKLVNVQDPAQANVYVVGHPETLAKVAADGSYTLSKVPVGDQRVVFYDGKDKAGVVDGVRVEGAKRASVTKDAAELPRAARVLVVARPKNGVKWTNATLSLDGTIFQDRPGGATELFPVPPGQWTVRSKLKGFKDKAVTLPLQADAQLELRMDELDDGAGRGCLSAGCEGALQCAGDGCCYTCNADADCGAGFACHSHTCVATDGGTSGGGADTCAACSTDAECGTSGSCVGGGAAGGYGGYCVTAASECRRGYAVGTMPGGSATACAPIPFFLGASIGDACVRVATAFGSACVQDATCAADLANGVCVKAMGAMNGSCSIRCSADRDCPRVSGFDHCSAGVCGR